VSLAARRADSVSATLGCGDEWDKSAIVVNWTS